MARWSTCLAVSCLVLAGAAFTPSSASAAPADPEYVVTEIPGLTSATAVNASGDVAGQLTVSCGSGPVFFSCPRAARYFSGTGLTTEVGAIGDGTSVYYSYAYGINAAGDVVGSFLAGSEPVRAVLYPAGGGGKHFLPFPPGTSSEARAINDAGLIVGYRSAGGPWSSGQAFLYDRNADPPVVDIHVELAAATGATHSQATAINAAGDVAGWYADGSWVKHAFVRHPGGSYEFLELPADLVSADADVTGINASGQVVATTNMTSGNWPMRAILWTDRTAEDLGMLPPAHDGIAGAGALGINGGGEVVGASNFDFVCTPGMTGGCFVATHAFRYGDGVMQDLNDLVPADSGWVLQAATALNDAGQIVAYGQHGLFSSGTVLLTPSPQAMIDDLIGIVEGFDLPHGIETSLLTKLRNALDALAAGDTATACDLLGAFVHETRAQSGKKIDADDAARLIASAEQIRATLGCS
jgi:probable HAF family extracellular repeat protein